MRAVTSCHSFSGEARIEVMLASATSAGGAQQRQRAAARTMDALAMDAVTGSFPGAETLELPCAGTLELILLSALWCIALCGARLDAANCAYTLRHVLTKLTIQSCLRRSYNAYLEWAYFSFPSLRTQPEKKQLRATDDEMGRSPAEESLIEHHDRLTVIGTLSLTLCCYLYFGARMYPTAEVIAAAAPRPLTHWFARLLAHHYAMSFGMYWAHRYCHVNKFLWRHIHQLHHYAKTPLAHARAEPREKRTRLFFSRASSRAPKFDFVSSRFFSFSLSVLSRVVVMIRALRERERERARDFFK